MVPAAHLVPQAPQLALSLSVAAQLVPHRVEPVGQEAATHAPAVQLSPAAH
jgi:hypothetical protein